VRKTLPALLVLCVLLSSALAYGCGDKLSAFTRAAHNNDLIRSARILLFAPAKSAAAVLAIDSQFQSAVKKGKHKLTVVDSADELRAQIGSGNFDLILADADAASLLEQQINSGLSLPMFVPVLDAPAKSELRAAERRYSVVLTAHSRTGQYLDTIDDAVGIRLRRSQPTRVARK
jgi:hypothetical protein